jgi:hypothetical protein
MFIIISPFGAAERKSLPAKGSCDQTQLSFDTVQSVLEPCILENNLSRIELHGGMIKVKDLLNEKGGLQN